MFTTLLIANRGEIACRIIRTARRMGISTIAIYSSADVDSLHVSMADKAFCVGDAPATDSYLNINAIINIAKQQGVDAIHPGYGFLSEHAGFANACATAHICFVGPSVSAMEAMASKQLAKERLMGTKVPLTPGYHGHNQTDQHLLDEGKRLGFPLLLKAASGGGGKGMRAVFNPDEFLDALSSARREALASFGDDTMIIERLIEAPRHIELQIMADNHGQVVHLFERDCSIQRRHQKIIEEAPANHLPDGLREHLARAAIEVAKAIDYRGAGTVEFILDKEGRFYFMEMNTRLQVEHPVTEMITGLDLVEWQLRIAANEPLPLLQKQIKKHGHAIECRVCAEDPDHDFLPSMGEITFLKEPVAENLRIDTGVVQHTVISRYYDSMIAKCIAWGETREEARGRLLEALKSYCIGGVKTNLTLLQDILQHPQFIRGEISTAFLQQVSFSKAHQHTLALHAAALMDYLKIASHPDPLYQDTFAWQLHLDSRWIKTYKLLDERVDIRMTPVGGHQVKLEILKPSHFSSAERTYQARLVGDVLYFNDKDELHHVSVEAIHDGFVIYTLSGPLTVTHHHENNSQASITQPDQSLTAPMPGTIVALFKKKGDVIHQGEPLLVLEAMKMEHTIRAPKDGTIKEIFYTMGTQVNEGAMLLALEET